MRYSLLIILLLIPFTAAEELDNTFDTAESALPRLPGEEGTSIELIDSKTKQKILSAHVIIQYDGTKSLQYTTTGSIQLPNNIEYPITIKIDIPQTEGKDYYRRIVEYKEKIEVLPIGSLKGTITREGQIVRNAKIKAECSALYGEFETTTDEYGSFSLDWLPQGNCKVHAKDSSYVDRGDAIIIKGALTNAEMELQHRIKKTNILLYIILGGAIILILLILTTAIKNKKQKSPKTENKTRYKDVLSTLNDRDQGIANYLKENGIVNQAELIHELRIPKTSISRILQHLETKNVITIKKVGKSKKIQLTDWILEKN